VISEFALLSPTPWQSGATVSGTLALQQFLNKGVTDTELVSNFLLRIVRVILEEQDDLFAEVIGIWNHPHILDDNYTYIQLETDLSL
jgi:hypothetical protein